METFIKAKLAWDPSLDPLALEKDFCEAWYGPAGGDAWEFLDCVFALIGDDRDESYPGERACVEKGLEAYERAVKAAAGTEFEKRLKDDSDLAGWAAEFEKRLAAMKQAEAAAPAPTKAPDAEKPERTLSLSKSTPMRRSGFKLDAEFTPLKTILVSGDLDEDYKAALALRKYIEETYKVALPVERNSVEISENTREAILVGRKAALASGLVAESDFEAAGPTGVVARGRDGRIALAATKDENISDAVEGFIHIDRARRPVAGGWRMTTFGWIREFTLIDRPPFGPVHPAGSN